MNYLSLYCPTYQSLQVKDIIMIPNGNIFSVTSKSGTSTIGVSYLCSLMGPTGPKGNTGPQGATGPGGSSSSGGSSVSYISSAGYGQTIGYLIIDGVTQTITNNVNINSQSYTTNGSLISSITVSGITASVYSGYPYFSGRGTSKMYFVGRTNVGANNTYGLYGNTLIYSAATTGYLVSERGFFESSDARLKEFGEDIPIDMEKVRQLPKKKFYWKDDESKTLHIGTSAQEIQKLFPEAVSESENGTLLVDYPKLSMVALRAIDVLYDENKKMKEDIEQLKRDVEILKNK
jgi:hypothetical protein